MNRSSHRITLDLRPLTHLGDDNRQDPIRFYRWPFLGELYRRRVEMCLEELEGGDHVLEVGFGSGVTFPSLHRLYRRISGLDLLADANRVERFWRKRGIVAHLCNGDVTAMPYADGSMDAVLLISILEHLEPPQLARALGEIHRVLRTGGQLVYGVPVERSLMSLAFRFLGYDIRRHHFSTEKDVAAAAQQQFKHRRIAQLRPWFGLLGPVYEVGSFVRTT